MCLDPVPPIAVAGLQVAARLMPLISNPVLLLPISSRGLHKQNSSSACYCTTRFDEITHTAVNAMRAWCVVSGGYDCDCR